MNVNDLISRAEALDAIDRERKLLIERGQYGAEHIVVHHARRQIEELLAVGAAPGVHGRWIKTTVPVNSTGHGGVGQDKTEGWLCSECRCAFDAKLLWCDSYCPNCGAVMKEVAQLNLQFQKVIKELKLLIYEDLVEHETIKSFGCDPEDNYTINPKDVVVDAINLIKEYDVALRMMVYQYCSYDRPEGECFKNNYMSAGETAFKLLGIENGQEVPEDFIWKER